LSRLEAMGIANQNQYCPANEFGILHNNFKGK
jgi:hypothetical protein